MHDENPSLSELVRDAAALARGATRADTDIREAARQLTICNACRYCEGYCAVFPALTRRLEFGANDLHYLANLCHQCGACFHACQYAPPHEFAVNVPRALAIVRADTYVQYAWPRTLARTYRNNGVIFTLATAIAIALFLLLAVARGQALVHAPMDGNFYAVFPHILLVALFGSTFGFALIALAVGGVRYWQAIGAGPTSSAALADASQAALTLRYLDGGHGDGCNDADDEFTHRRRFYHHLTFYGFALCFASTVIATAYHYLLNEAAPYALTSVPVLLGTIGGIGLLIGPAGLLRLSTQRDARTMAAAQTPIDRAFILQLMLVSATGIALLVLRDTSAMASLLCVHLGFVLALFLTLPYGKFAHGVYRSLALLKWSIERRTPNPVAVAGD